MIKGKDDFKMTLITIDNLVTITDKRFKYYKQIITLQENYWKTWRFFGVTGHIISQKLVEDVLSSDNLNDLILKNLTRGKSPYIFLSFVHIGIIVKNIVSKKCVVIFF